VFGGIRRLLDSQVERPPQVEQDVLTWLAVERETASLAELTTDMGTSVGLAAVLDAVETLRRRSLVERVEPGATFTLQSVAQMTTLPEHDARATNGTCFQVAVHAYRRQLAVLVSVTGFRL
jgi:hypothetical protein